MLYRIKGTDARTGKTTELSIDAASEEAAICRAGELGVAVQKTAALPPRGTAVGRLKTCPHCAETDLQHDAVVCKHCGKNFQSWWDRKMSACSMLGVLALVGGFCFWPLWIVAAALLVIGALSD